MRLLPHHPATFPRNGRATAGRVPTPPPRSARSGVVPGHSTGLRNVDSEDGAGQRFYYLSFHRLPDQHGYCLYGTGALDRDTLRRGI